MVNYKINYLIFHLVVLEAAHVAMRGYAVRAEEVCAVAAACERLLARLATRAHDLHVVYREHVKDLDQNVVERQRLDAPCCEERNKIPAYSRMNRTKFPGYFWHSILVTQS